MLYRPPHFRCDDRPRLEAFVRAHPFATLITWGGEECDLSPLPLLLHEGKLLGHLARANPQWRRWRPEAPAVALFQGADAYVSPNYYPGKREHGRVVPTWNYSVVQAVGPLRIFEEPAHLLELVTRLTERHEAGRPTPWQVGDAPPDYIAQQLRGIVGVELTIERLEGSLKLSQNRNDADRAGVMQGLAAEGDAEAQAVAAAMRHT